MHQHNRVTISLCTPHASPSIMWTAIRERCVHSWEITRFPFISPSFRPILPPPLPCFIFSLSVTSLARCRINDLRDCRTCELRYLTSIGDTWWLSPQCDKKQERLSISWRNRICIAILLALNKRILPESGS